MRSIWVLRSARELLRQMSAAREVPAAETMPVILTTGTWGWGGGVVAVPFSVASDDCQQGGQGYGLWDVVLKWSIVNYAW